MAEKLFTPREWIALFPAQPPDDGDATFLGDAPPDPAAALRAAEPLTFDVLLSAVPDPLLRWQMRAAWSLEPLSVRILLRYGALFSLALVLCGSVWTLNTGVYGGPQITAAFTGYSGVAALTMALFVATRFREDGWAALYRPFRRPVATTAPAAAPLDVSTHPFAGLARWCQLVGLSPAFSGYADLLSAPEAGRLVEHRDGDRDCPCALPSCMGGAPGSIGLHRIAATAMYFAVELVEWLLLVWSPVVVLSSRTWTSRWAAPTAAVYLFVVVVHSVPTAVGITTTAVPALTLARKLHRRAVKLALQDLLSRCSSPTPLADPSPDEPYVQLHLALAATYVTQLRFVSNGQAVVLTAGAAIVVAAAANAAVGQCIPAYLVLMACYLTLGPSWHMSFVAVWNSSIASVTDLYLGARTALALLGPRSAHPETVERHMHVLELLADGMTARRGRFLGFAVGLGTVRTYLATLFTVALGLWTLLRGAGIAFVPDSVCPG
ncbi:hypothetical protein DFJ74DRAFT_682487 [Hyaloraphidium curvatum]|nr:hypothetical protein DFJ74DRAFT_682487 [Hyaloraphidium curvatum]